MMDIAGTMIAQEPIHPRERIGNVLIAQTVDNVQVFARAGVKKPQAVLRKIGLLGIRKS
jgi:hypothetical protein